MSKKFVALLRDVNVGGKAKIRMAELKSAMSKAGYSDIQSYINSGNLIFLSENTDTLQLSKEVEKIIHNSFEIYRKTHFKLGDNSDAGIWL